MPRKTRKTNTKRRNKRAGTPPLKRPSSPRAKLPPKKSRKTSSNKPRDRTLRRDRTIEQAVFPVKPFNPDPRPIKRYPNARKLRDESTPSNTRTQEPQRQSAYNPVLLMPTPDVDDYAPMNQRLEELIADIEKNQIEMNKKNIPTKDWEKYKLDNSPITSKAAQSFERDQADIISDFEQEKQEQEQKEHRENIKITNKMLKKTGNRTSLMTLGLLATLMANNLYTDKPEGIPPYQLAIADTPADIVHKARGNDGLIQGVEEMKTSNPNYYRIYSKGKIINFDPSTTTMKQWDEAKKKAILEQKPFSIYDDQDAVKFFLEQGNKDLYGIALKKISQEQQKLLERARLAQVIKEEEKQRRHKIRGYNKQNKRNNKRNNYNKHNNQFKFTRRGGKK